MYIVAIGWIFVVVLMAATSRSLLGAAGILLGYGLLPLALFLWIAGTARRRRRASLRDVADEDPHQRD